MVSFITSCKNKNNYPDSLKEVVFVGKSNVGKSSIINCLYGKIAYVGKTPGKTKLLNFFDVDGKYTICDVPGYGYAKLSGKEIVDFGEMMEEYFKERSALKLCVLILDIRHKPNEDDLTMINYLAYNHIPTIYVFNKADKLSNNEINNQIKIIKNIINNDNEYLVTSCLNKKNIDKLKDAINKYVD